MSPASGLRHNLGGTGSSNVRPAWRVSSARTSDRPRDGRGVMTALRIALLLRNIDERGGAAIYARRIIENLLAADHDNDYLLVFASEEARRRHGHPRARNLAVEASS